MMLTDEELLTRFANPREREFAFTQLVKKYQQKLYWHIRRIVISHEDADDVIQNTFIKIWKNLHNFKGESQLYTWFYRIATNESITFINNRKKRVVVSMDDTDEHLINTLKADKNFNASAAEWKLQQAILMLPEKQRIVFNLRYFDEMPYEEMSKILDTTEGALKASYHHAVKKVEDYLINH
ncbi:MAG: RNA polymerase sigma factor [Bacteroidota bacterium]|jgi:RNA polymerase sigma-70 factor (ECF subfamily)|nr:RNA polymerase sigma factor [Bacteroidota bacterium]GDX47369.1 DNA-directed RNA polymerase sigma-70 factor [Bacteroidota bacterium]